MEEINSENKIDWQLINYQIYCSEVNLYNENIDKLKIDCETILISYNFKMLKKHRPLSFIEYDEYIRYIKDLLQFIEIPIYDYYNENKWTQMCILKYNQDIFISNNKKIENFNKEPNIYNIYYGNFIEPECKLSK